jgi:hypothetical protein
MAKAARSTKSGRNVHYMIVVSEGPRILIRTPWPTPRWSKVLKALTPVMRSFDMQQKSIVEICSATDKGPDEEWFAGDHAVAAGLDAAYNGALKYKMFNLFDWVNDGFKLVRKAVDE